MPTPISPAYGAATSCTSGKRRRRPPDRTAGTLREPLLLCTVAELSHAEALEITAKTVETPVRRARAALSGRTAES